MKTSKIAFYISLGLFLVSLLLPAVYLSPWPYGWGAFCFSFLGLILSMQAPIPFIACLMGASANALMLFAYFRIWRNRYQTPAAATTAVILTLLVLIPLSSMTRLSVTRVVSFGYYIWVAAAFTLAISAWLQAGELVKPTEPPLKSSSRIWVTIPCLLALIVGTIFIRAQRKTSEDVRCATEGQAAVEAFLRDGAGGAFTNYGSTNYGAFLSLEGSGYYPAVWNIQGYHYLGLDRTAHFSQGSLRIRIYVTEGRKTAPGLKTVGNPEIKDGSIFVSPSGFKIKIVKPALAGPLPPPFWMSFGFPLMTNMV